MARIILPEIHEIVKYVIFMNIRKSIPNTTDQSKIYTVQNVNHQIVMMFFLNIEYNLFIGFLYYYNLNRKTYEQLL